MYVCYTTMWSEGVVVVKDTDTKFAIGHDPINGGVLYSKTLEDIDTIDIITCTEDIDKAANMDTAFYLRFPKDPKELQHYRNVRNNRKKKANVPTNQHSTNSSLLSDANISLPRTF